MSFDPARVGGGFDSRCHAALCQGAPAGTLCFGPYRLSQERLLLRDGKPVQLGARAMEILVVLAEHAGQVVAKRELLVRVWPGTAVDEPALRFQVAALRKALGGAKSDSRYIQTVSGLGYRFVAPVAASADLAATAVPANPPAVAAPVDLTTMVAPADFTAVVAPASFARGATILESPREHPLTSQPERPVGRSRFLDLLVDSIPKRRLVTLAGPGGVGKTTMAIASVERLRDSFAQGTLLVDFAPLADASLVPSSIATALGLADHSADPMPDTIEFLRSRQILLVLDTCEHVAEPVARFVEAVVDCAPRVCIVATSREALRARGEWVKRLPPLPLPPSEQPLTATEALRFPAIELFRDRATAAVRGFKLTDADAPAVIDLCRRLDGIPLAIELAAAHLPVFSVRGLAARIDEWFRLRARNRRTATPRHETLWALIEWSFQLLSAEQQVVLRRLSLFPQAFSEQDARVLTSGLGINAAAVPEALASLVAKSLITADPVGGNVSFQLLETVRTLARHKLNQSPERELLERRHTQLCLKMGENPGRFRNNAH